MNEKIYIVWIWWIWISAIARYYNENWYIVSWSDKNNSELIKKLQEEWINIIIGENSSRIDKNFKLLIYSEAISRDQIEIQKAKNLWIKVLSYPESLAEIANKNKLVAISWTHWKSTTTSIISLIMKDTRKSFSSVVWTLLKEFWWKNFFHQWDIKWQYFILEACEYKRSFLAYKPYIWIIINIEIDHLDYYKNLDDYLEAFKDFLYNIKTWWYAIINWFDKNIKTITWLRKDIKYIKVYNKYFIYNKKIIYFPKINLQVAWKHILYDAYISYVVWYVIWIKSENIVKSIEKYKWAWRRMEIIKKSSKWNILISDYGHHPTEIKLTLKALKEKYKNTYTLVVFQAHQYNRTIELLKDFKNCFINSNELIISDIYESRDTKEDKLRINNEIFFNEINHNKKIKWWNLENTLEIIKKWEEKNSSSIILLLWAGNIDNLRYEIN